MCKIDSMSEQISENKQQRAILQISVNYKHLKPVNELKSYKPTQTK